MAGFEFSSDLMRQLNQTVSEYTDAASEAQRIAQETILQSVRETAKESPRWRDLADYVDTWDENDRFWIGIRGPEYVSEAFAVEYGTDEYPPEPIMRTLDGAARVAGYRVSSFLNSRFGATASTTGVNR